MASQRHILVIEDDQAIRETIAEILELEGYFVTIAKNGEVGLQQLLEQPRTPDLILLDLMMPVMDGFTFRSHQLKNPSWAKIPVVVMSADGRVQEKLKKIGGKAYLRKPPELEKLISVVSKCFTDETYAEPKL